MMLKTLDVAIGLSFLYLLSTFVASAVVEFISNWQNWRGQMLHDAIRNMLSHSKLVTADDIYRNPLIAQLGRNDAAPSWLDFLEKRGWRPKINGKTVTFPSYIPAAHFSAAIIDALNHKAGGGHRDGAPPPTPDESVAIIKATLKQEARSNTEFGKDGLRAVLQTTLALRGDNIQAVQFALEKWFNDTMDRASGWYKRRSQSCLLLIGLVIAYGGNIDTIAVSLWLWQGDAARQAVVSAATDYVKSHPAPADASAKPDDAAKAQIAAIVDQVTVADQLVTSTQYPVGWAKWKWSIVWLLQYAAGGLISAIAISMGSPFWFDALQNLLKIRGSGPKPGTR
jgi:hypothetical protein